MGVAGKKPKATQKSKAKKAGRGNIYHEVKRQNDLNTAAGDPVVSYTSRIRAIGNSHGIILNSKIMDAAGFKPDTDITLHSGNGIITIMRQMSGDVNTDLSTWDEHFKNAIRKGASPEGDLFEDVINEFDKEEW